VKRLSVRKRMRDRILTREEAQAGWDRFWARNQVKEFLRSSNGRYARDRRGNLVAIRTKDKRVLPSTKFDYRKFSYGSGKDE